MPRHTSLRKAMPIAVIINNKINDNCLFRSHSESLVMQSRLAVPEESLCGRNWCRSAHCRTLRVWGAVFGGVRLCQTHHKLCPLILAGGNPAVRPGNPPWPLLQWEPQAWGIAVPPALSEAGPRQRFACEGGKVSALTATGAFREGNSWELLA